MSKQVINAFSYTLAVGETSYVVAANMFSAPMSISLVSSDVTRAIAISFDGGTEYFTVTPDFTSATQIVFGLLAPVTNIKVTGVATNKLTVSH